jgi:ribosome-associated toxin RatA of RatAB toxin-antitoxin module
MAKLSRTTTVHARADDVFHFLEDKTHFPEFWPSMMEVSDIRDLPNGGKQLHWKYKMAGLRLDGDSEEIEFIPNRKLVAKSQKGIESTVTWLLDGHGDDTDLTFEVDYKVPVPVLGKLAEKVVVKLNEHEADAVIANIKTQIEA